MLACRAKCSLSSYSAAAVVSNLGSRVRPATAAALCGVQGGQGKTMFVGQMMLSTKSKGRQQDGSQENGGKPVRIIRQNSGQRNKGKHGRRNPKQSNSNARRRRRRSPVSLKEQSERYNRSLRWAPRQTPYAPYAGLPTLDASAFLDPHTYCRKSSFSPSSRNAAGGGRAGTIDGTQAAKRLRRGKEMLLNVVKYQLANYAHNDNHHNTTHMAGGTPFILTGHGVPAQLLTDHLNLCQATLQAASTHAATPSRHPIKECFFRSSDHQDPLHVAWMHVRDGMGTNAVMPWPPSPSQPQGDPTITQDQEQDQDLTSRLRLYLAVMHRIASIFGWLIHPRTNHALGSELLTAKPPNPNYWNVHFLHHRQEYNRHSTTFNKSHYAKDQDASLMPPQEMIEPNPLLVVELGVRGRAETMPQKDQVGKRNRHHGKIKRQYNDNKGEAPTRIPTIGTASSSVRNVRIRLHGQYNNGNAHDATDTKNAKQRVSMVFDACFFAEESKDSEESDNEHDL